MKIHSDIKKDDKNLRTYKVEVEIPKTNTPIVPGEPANRNIADALNYFENVIMEHKWIDEMGYEEKIEVLRQYSLYWFLRNILQVDYYPLPVDGEPESGSCPSS